MKKKYKFLTFLIPTLLVILLWGLTNNNLFIFFIIDLKHGLIVGSIFLLIEHYFLKKITKPKIWYVRIALFLLVFVLTIIIDFTISYQGVIEPIKSIFNNKLPHSAQYN